MSFTIPSLPDLSKRIYGYMRARFMGTEPELWPNNLRVIGKVQAMAHHEADLRAQYLARQLFTTTADQPYLRLHAYEHGVDEKPASPAVGELLFEATDSVTFAAGIRFARADGATYVSTEAVTASGGFATIPVEAELAGVAGNTPGGGSFVLMEATADLADEGVATVEGLVGGSDGESAEALRSRVLFRKRNRTRGGRASDYVEWAMEVPGVRTAFVKGWEPGAGAVSVYPILDGEGMAAIPTTGDLAIVAAHLEMVRPITAQVFVVQAAARVINYTITDLDTDTFDVREEIVAELKDMHAERAFVALPGETSTFSRSWMTEAISAAVGEGRHVLVSPAGDVGLAPGEYPVLGTVTFT